MCGVAVILGPRARSKTNIQAMVQSLSHRGPDANGVKILDGCVLGHTRLSIIDLDPRSNQPMPGRNRGAWLVFNGEIYNYRELRRELNNYPFTTQSDSEVILAAYEKWGAKCVHHFNGMFAFAIYDPESGELFAARDRFGIKPLFYSQDGENIYLASEAKAILTQCTVEPNEDYFLRYLKNGDRLRGNESCFDNIHQLWPGEWMRIADGQLTRKRYYDIGARIRAGDFEPANTDSALETFQEHFHKSLELRTRADVPVSVSYSGGLDSSVMLHILGKSLHRSDVLAQAAVSKAVPEQDKKYLEDVAQECGFEVDYCVTDDVTFIQSPDLEKMMWHCEAPFKASHYLDRSLAARSREKGRIVILDGNGSDEYMLGYYSHLLSAMPEFLMTGRWRHFLKVLLGTSWHREKAALGDFAMSMAYRLRGKQSDYKCAGWPITETTSFFFEDKLQALLWFRDRSSMTYGTELRVPFLDHKLVEAMLALPLESNISARGQKSALREFAACHLPAQTLQLRKNSFLKPDLPRSFVRSYHGSMKSLAEELETPARRLVQASRLDYGNSRNATERVGQVELWFRQFQAA